MFNNNILFDDWQTRCDDVLKHRRWAYTFCLIFFNILFLGLVIGAFFKLYLVVPLVLSFISLIAVLLEWMKVKNNHLVIKSNQLEITNRFNKTKIYKIHIYELSLVLKPPFYQRGGGIIMKFYDAKGNLICKYEDMFNRAAPWGFEKTNWEKSIEGLGIEIIDASGIIKN